MQFSGSEMDTPTTLNITRLAYVGVFNQVQDKAILTE
jgi:hypothetical protein